MADCASCTKVAAQVCTTLLIAHPIYLCYNNYTRMEVSGILSEEGSPMNGAESVEIAESDPK